MVRALCGSGPGDGEVFSGEAYSLDPPQAEPHVVSSVELHSYSDCGCPEAQNLWFKLSSGDNVFTEDCRQKESSFGLAVHSGALFMSAPQAWTHCVGRPSAPFWAGP